MPLVSQIAGRLLRLPAPLTRELHVERDLPVSMDDGVVLYADRYAPPANEPRADRAGPLAVRARRGVRLSVRAPARRARPPGPRPEHPRDVRLGRAVRARSTSATTAWRRCAGCASSRGTTGRSARSDRATWASCSGRSPTQVDAMAPSVTASQFQGQAYGNGSISLDTALSWMLLLQVQERRLGAAAAGARAAPHAARRCTSTCRSASSTARVRRAGRVLPRMARAPVAGQPVLGRARLLDHRSATSPAPVQLVGGWYDIFLPWMIEDFHALRAAGRRPQLIIGPWTHTSAGLVSAGLREGLGWLRAHLLGDRRHGPRHARARVRDRRGGAGATCPTGRRPAHASERCTCGQRRPRVGGTPTGSPDAEPLPLRPRAARRRPLGGADAARA